MTDTNDPVDGSKASEILPESSPEADVNPAEAPRCPTGSSSQFDGEIDELLPSRASDDVDDTSPTVTPEADVTQSSETSSAQEPKLVVDFSVFDDDLENASDEHAEPPASDFEDGNYTSSRRKKKKSTVIIAITFVTLVVLSSLAAAFSLTRATSNNDAQIKSLYDNPCQLFSKEAASDLLGAPVTSVTPGDNKGNHTCVWVASGTQQSEIDISIAPPASVNELLAAATEPVPGLVKPVSKVPFQVVEHRAVYVTSLDASHVGSIAVLTYDKDADAIARDAMKQMLSFVAS